MLFQDHIESYEVKQGEVVYYVGAFSVSMKERILGTIVGIKQMDGNIRVKVEYHTSVGQVESRLQKVMSPADLERIIASIDSQFKVTEIHYRSRTLDDAFTAHLDDEEKELIHQGFLLRIMNGQTRTDAYENTIDQIKRTVTQRIGG